MRNDQIIHAWRNKKKEKDSNINLHLIYESVLHFLLYPDMDVRPLLTEKRIKAERLNDSLQTSMTVALQRLHTGVGLAVPLGRYETL